MTDMTLKHPDSKATVKVSEEAAEAYLSQGWAESGAKAKDDGDK